MAFSIRYFRRRGVGTVCKILAVTVFIVTLLQLTVSAPNREVIPRAETFVDRKPPQQPVVAQIPKKVDEQVEEDEDVDRDHLEKDNDRKQQKPFVFQQHEPTHRVRPDRQQQQQQQQVIKPLEKVQPKKDRSSEFYENVIVHFDLKGAPPKVPYFLELIELVARSGATGILMEWEEMFPYTGKLESVRGTDAYSMEDVRKILGKAKSLNLDIIPLVQTFGHLEWILKFEEFRKYRQMDEYPQVICLGDDEAIDLVKDALTQVIDVHKEYGIPYFHIGADEAFMYGVCQKDMEWIQKYGAEGGKERLALTHMKKMAEFVKEKIGSDKTILGWHDLIKNFPPTLVKSVGLGDVLEPVIWDYSENIVTMNEWNFAQISENFKTVWASSAYKGANFPSAKYIDVRHYEANNRQWIDVINSNKNKFKNFHGIIITGWQRYDHMAGLCEILPMGTPSMVLQVETALSAHNKQDQKGIRTRAAEKLKCAGGQFIVNDRLDLVNSQCDFPGFSVYSIFQRDVRRTIEYVEEEMKKNHPTIGWLNSYAMRHDMTQNWYLREITGFLQTQMAQLKQVERSLRQAMQPLFFENTLDEYVFETLGELMEKIAHMLKEADRLSKLRVWPKRHFKIKTEL